MKLKQTFKKFMQNRKGIVFEGIIAISFIFFSSIIWLIGALVVNQVFDALMPWFDICDPRALAAAQTNLTAYGVSVVIVDALFIVWWGLSVFKSGSRESPAGEYSF